MSKDLLALQDLFTEFLEWADAEAKTRQPSTETEGETHRGLALDDILPRLALNWEDWGVQQSTLLQQMARRLDNASEQKAFLDWLKDQSDLLETAWPLMCYQLVQCLGFRQWTELKPYQRLLESWQKVGAYGVVVEGDKAQVCQAAVILCRPSQDRSPQSALMPINIVADSDMTSSLNAGHQAVGNLLSRSPIWVLLAVWFGNDWLFNSLRRTPVSLWWRLRLAWKEHNSFIVLDMQPKAEIAGGSFALAAAIALLLALLRHCFKEGKTLSAGAHSKFRQQLFPRLWGSAFTGQINNGNVKIVDAIDLKLAAMEKHPIVNCAVIPAESKPTKGYDLKLYEAESLEQVVRWLMRFSWVQVVGNICLLAALCFVVAKIPDGVDRYARAPPTLNSIAVGEKSYALNYLLKEDIPVQQRARLTLYLENARDDGATFVEVRAHSRQEQGARFECLQSPDPKEKDDLHPEVMLPVQQGKATFDYLYRSNICDGTTSDSVEIGRETLSVAIWRKGRFVQQYPLTLAVK